MFTHMPPGAVLAGTGHRPAKLGGYGPSPMQSAIRGVVAERLSHYRQQFSLLGIYSGMALGFDTWWMEEALNLRIPVVAVVPFAGQDGRWPAQSRKHYRALLKRAHHVITLQTAKGGSDRDVSRWLLERDAWMVDNAWGLVACHDGSLWGGTFHTVQYAQLKQKPVDRFNPWHLVRT